MDVIRVILVDDHPVLRTGARDVLQRHSDLRVVGETGLGAEAAPLAAALAPDVAVLDMWLPDLGGPEVIARIATAAPSTRCLVWSAFCAEQDVGAALGAGACGYLLTSARSGALAQAVRDVARGETVLDPSIAANVARRWAHHRGPAAAANPWAALTPREVSVLRLIVAGLRNRAIAEQLHLSVRTVESHIEAIFGKLGVSSRTEAAMAVVSRNAGTPRFGPDRPVAR